MQDFPTGRILLCGKEVGERSLEADKFLVAFGESADSDQRETQVLEDLSFGQLVECLVGQGHAPGCQVRQYRCDGLFGEPAVGGDGMFGGSDVVAQGQQPRSEVGRGRADDLVEAPVDQTPLASPGFRVVGVAAGGAVEPGRGRRAVGAERAGQGAGSDRSELGAARAFR